MRPSTEARTPPQEIWTAAATQAATEAGVPLAQVVGPFKNRKAATARWRAWKHVLDQNPQYSIAGLGRASGWDHSSIIWGLRRLGGMPAPCRREINKMRRQFSDHTMAENARLGMTAEEFARAVGLPVDIILRRAKRAGIIMKREQRFYIGCNVPELVAARLTNND